MGGGGWGTERDKKAQPGLETPPQAEDSSRVPRKVLPSPSSPGTPRDSADLAPRLHGAPRLSPRSAGRAGRDSQLGNRLGLTPWGGFYTQGGGRSGVTGPRANRIGRLPAIRPRPRSVRDVGATSEVREGPDFCWTRARSALCLSRATLGRRLIQQRAPLPTSGSYELGSGRCDPGSGIPTPSLSPPFSPGAVRTPEIVRCLMPRRVRNRVPTLRR